MTADASSEIRRAMWVLLIVTHLAGFCCADASSVEDIIISYINCTYFDCDETFCYAEYDSDGIGCIDANMILISDISDEVYTVAHTYRCIMDECETPLGIDANGTLADVISGHNIWGEFFKGLGMELCEDCNCVQKESTYSDTVLQCVDCVACRKAPKGARKR